jgi:hypothetical protein
MEADPHGSTPEAECVSARRWPTNWRPIHHRESDDQDAQASAQEAASKGVTEALSVENARKEADGVHCD